LLGVWDPKSEHSSHHRAGVGLGPRAGENMLSTELIDPFGNLIRFFERNVTL
jgi:hypothetical protein